MVKVQGEQQCLCIDVEGKVYEIDCVNIEVMVMIQFWCQELVLKVCELEVKDCEVQVCEQLVVVQVEVVIVKVQVEKVGDEVCIELVIKEIECKIEFVEQEYQFKKVELEIWCEELVFKCEEIVVQVEVVKVNGVVVGGNGNSGLIFNVDGSMLLIGGDKDVSFRCDVDGKIQGVVIKNVLFNGKGVGECEFK